MGQRFDDIQVLRCVAATGVVVAHAVDLSAGRLGLGTVLAGGPWEDFGAAGVDLFFVISGFIIATTTRGQTGLRAAGAFLWRRFRRVAPIYWLLSLPILVGMARGGTLTADVVAATFLFWPFSGLEMTFPALGAGWTLCFEMLFYAGVGLAIAGGGRAGRALAGGAVVAVVVGLAVATPVLRFVGSPMVLEFLIGVGIARWGRGQPQAWGVVAVGLGLIGFGLSLGFGYGEIDGEAALNQPWVGLARVAIWGLPAGLVVLGAVVGARRRQGPVWRGLIFMGDASYAVYLFHVLVIRALGRVFEAGAVLPGDGVVVLTVGLSLAAGAGVHVWVERPLMRWMARPHFSLPFMGRGDRAAIGVGSDRTRLKDGEADGGAPDRTAPPGLG
ncbi:acyltransferase [Brevundimonas intermedia]|uniref:Acyltransferase n=1 Tax=Brevundimonas intermedia TaxID=74315 RepID=A0ABQ5T3H2_9CAUL|nr:acyltransferase [Brevundimonas intermedia]GLK47302.1 acyltransferase [Brevundimonas intermedia]